MKSSCWIVRLLYKETTYLKFLMSAPALWPLLSTGACQVTTCCILKLYLSACSLTFISGFRQMCCRTNGDMTPLCHIFEITMLHPTGMFAEQTKHKVTLVTLLIITRSTPVLCLSYVSPEHSVTQPPAVAAWTYAALKRI